MKYTRIAIVIFSAALLLTSCYKNDGFGSAGYVDYAAVTGDIYAELEENPFVIVADKPVSTFSIDADGASYANIRRYIFAENQLPPKAAIRTEELINYFDMGYEFSSTEHPISVNGEVSNCPWTEGNKLVRIGIKGKHIPKEVLPPSNFVFLIDVSGSMGSTDKLDLLKKGFILLTDELSANDRIAIVTYAGEAGLLLESTSGNEKTKIKNAINSLGSGGSTAGAAGINTAYEIATGNFIAGGNNRVILGTDGDFNVGVSSREELIQLIEQKRKSGIFLTVLGVGRGNLNDAALEQIANKGNGTYEYIDNLEQLKKVFIYEKNKFYTVAKDVKVQVEFNPQNVKAYRLIGYENRLLSDKDFANDSTDAGEIGSDQNITALYEVVPEINAYYKTVPTFTIDFRYKQPAATTATQLSLDIFDNDKSFLQASNQMILSSSAAAFSMVLSKSDYKGNSSYTEILNWLNKVNMPDTHGYIKEFKNIITKAKSL